ncbi:MAG: hypothetical protein TU35_004755 [Thermoproteus sp. AZ2]|uniref:Uncharacterized protein n=1 Tax=Thermoproteus sp. AZ2 TaxID=1609232 RepID=A0ACC6V0H3_9CREN
MIINAWYSQAAWEAYKLIIGSPDFYIFEVALLLVAPFILAVVAYYKGNMPALLAAATLLVVAGFVDKYDLIIDAQRAPIAYSLSAWADVGYPYYSPSLSQIEIALGSVLFYVALLILGVLILPLMPSEKPKRFFIFK